VAVGRAAAVRARWARRRLRSARVWALGQHDLLGYAATAGWAGERGAGHARRLPGEGAAGPRGGGGLMGQSGRAAQEGKRGARWASWGIGLLSLLFYFFLFYLKLFSLIQIQPRSTILDRCTSKQTSYTNRCIPV
jgi:hypothetical protein